MDSVTEDQFLLEASAAAEKAHKMGLKYAGYGKWKTAAGETVAKTVQDKLIPIGGGTYFTKKLLGKKTHSPTQSSASKSKIYKSSSPTKPIKTHQPDWHAALPLSVVLRLVGLEIDVLPPKLSADDREKIISQLTTFKDNVEFAIHSPEKNHAVASLILDEIPHIIKQLVIPKFPLKKTHPFIQALKRAMIKYVHKAHNTSGQSLAKEILPKGTRIITSEPIPQSIFNTSHKMAKFLPIAKSVKKDIANQYARWSGWKGKKGRMFGEVAESWVREGVWVHESSQRREIFNAVNNAIFKNPKDLPVVHVPAIYRGMVISPKNVKKFLKNFQIGKTLQLPPSGFSCSEERAQAFAKCKLNATCQGVRILIRLKSKNKKILGLHISRTDDGAYEHEVEVIRPSKVLNTVSAITYIAPNMQPHPGAIIIDLEETGRLAKKVKFNESTISYMDKPQFDSPEDEQECREILVQTVGGPHGSQSKQNQTVNPMGGPMKQSNQK